MPQLTIALLKKLIGKNFENAEALEAKSEYRRQIRGLGVGLAAGGVAGLVLERLASDGGNE